jgi:hypothetical protein
MIAALLSVVVMKAQKSSNEEIGTIFGRGAESSIGWFVGVESGYTKFDTKEVWMGGLNGGMVINHSLSIGLGGYGWTNRKGMYYPAIDGTEGAYLEGGYGGLHVELSLFPKSPVHLTFPVLIGGGAATYVSGEESLEWDDDEWDTEHEVLDYDGFFVVEPGARAEINLLKFMRLSAGVSYRYVNDLDLVNTNSNMMNNFTANVGLKFGKF